MSDRLRGRLLLAALVVTAWAAAGSSGSDGAQPPAQGLAGTTWHTVEIEGDALFFVIRAIGIRFEDDERFAAAVRFVDGQQAARTGTYRVPRPGTLLLTVDGMGKPKTLTFRRDGPDLIVRDRLYDVTLRLAAGRMQEERWF